MESRISRFWTMFGVELDDPASLAACAAICQELKTIHGCITVKCMTKVSWGVMKTLVCKHNGNQVGWLTSLEGLLDHSFTRIPSSAPASACLAMAVSSATPDTSEPVRNVEHFPPAFKLGAHLIRTQRIQEIAPPYHTYQTSHAFETQFPERQRLSSNDTRWIAAEGFEYMATQWDHVAGDKHIFTQMAKGTTLFFPLPFQQTAGATWYKIYKNHFKQRRSTHGQVRRHMPSLLSQQATLLSPSNFRAPCTTSTDTLLLNPMRRRTSTSSAQFMLSTSRTTPLPPSCSRAGWLTMLVSHPSTPFSLHRPLRRRRTWLLLDLR